MWVDFFGDFERIRIGQIRIGRRDRKNETILFGDEFQNHRTDLNLNVRWLTSDWNSSHSRKINESQVQNYNQKIRSKFKEMAKRDTQLLRRHQVSEIKCHRRVLGVLYRKRLYKQPGLTTSECHFQMRDLIVNWQLSSWFRLVSISAQDVDQPTDRYCELKRIKNIYIIYIKFIAAKGLDEMVS